MLHRLAVTGYAICLKAFSRAHRDRYGREMVEAFERELSNLRVQRGSWSALRFAVAACLNTVAEGLGERRRRRRAMRSRPSGDNRGAGILRRVAGMSLDFRLGVRMMVKRPGITVLAVLTLALAIGICTATFELVSQLRQPDLRIGGGDELVLVKFQNRGDFMLRSPRLRDFEAWQGETSTIVELGAFRILERNIAVPGGSFGLIRMAEFSPSALRIVDVPARLGRHLVDEDAELGAPPVALIGHDFWQTMFSGDPGVLGRVVDVGGEEVTVVGVMPEGFAFPINQTFWMPLKPAREDPLLRVWTFGRLAPGVSIEAAHAEMSAFVAGRRPVAEEGELLRTEVLPYAQGVREFSTASAYSANLRAIAFLVLLCANVALLLFVRVVSREGEIVVRSALGATRSRIIAQLVAEALVLATLAVALGLGLAAFGLRSGMETVGLVVGGAELPYWVSDRLSLRSIVYAVALAVPCALICGALPALSATKGGLENRLRSLGVGETTMDLGRFWSIAVVAQVALVVAYVPIFMRLGLDLNEIRTTDLGVDGSEYLVARLAMFNSALGIPSDTLEGATRFQATYTELKERLEGEPGVTGVTFSSTIPGFGGREGDRVEVEEGESTRAYRVHVDLDYFDTFRMGITLGRAFLPGDVGSGDDVVIVNESFVREVFGARNPVGQRIRYQYTTRFRFGRGFPEQAPEPWREIIGVVSDVRMSLSPAAQRNGAIYHPTELRPRSVHTLSDAPPEWVAIHFQGDRASLFLQLLRTAAAVDPELRLDDVQTLDNFQDVLVRTYSVWLQLAFLVGGVAVVLAISGVYSILSFTVARRTREIGIRLALGATRWHVVSVVFRRALLQLGFGVAIGGAILIELNPLGINTFRAVPLLLAASALILAAAGIAACAIPLRRALRVEPTEAIAAGG